MSTQQSLRSVACLGFLTFTGTLLFASAACTGGEDIIPGGDGGSGGQSVAPQAGTAPGAGTSPLAMGGMAGNGVSSGGMSGTGVVGGMAGSSAGTSAGGISGSGGGPPEPNLMDAVKGWDGWRYELPCKSYPGGAPLDDNCSQNDVCWVGTDAVSPYKESKDIVMGGDPTKVYELELHARGVIEPKVHSGCEVVSEQAEPQGGIRVCKGGADGGSGFNLWSITITDPPQQYWMNDADNDNHRTNILNGHFKVQARGGTKITFNFDNKNTGQINNGCPAFRKTVEGVAPYPGYFVGNFFQLNVVAGSVKTL